MSSLPRIPLALAREVDKVYASIPVVDCQGNCQAYCCPVGGAMTAFERDRIIAATDIRPNSVSLDLPPGKEVPKCNLLSADGRCSVYDIRPTICRLWGAVEGMPCPQNCKGSASITDASGMEYAKVVRKVVRPY